MPLLGLLFAITLSLKDYPPSVESEAEFSVTAVLECSRCGDSHLRAVFFPSGTNYFGFTQNNSGSWISTTSDKTQYFAVPESQIQSGSWSGRLRVRPDSSSTDYAGPGKYYFKLIRYTASGSKSAETDPVSIEISGPAVTSVPSPTSTAAPSARPSPQPLVPLSTPTPQPTPSLAAVHNEILGTSDTISDPTPAALSVTAAPEVKVRKFPYAGVIFISLGFLSLGWTAVSLVYSRTS